MLFIILTKYTSLENKVILNRELLDKWGKKLPSREDNSSFHDLTHNESEGKMSGRVTSPEKCIHSQKNWFLKNKMQLSDKKLCLCLTGF